MRRVPYTGRRWCGASRGRGFDAEVLGEPAELTPSACQRCGIPWDEFQYQVQLAREFGLEHDGPDDDEPIAFAAAG